MSLLELLTLAGCFVLGVNCGYLVAMLFLRSLGSIATPASMLIGGILSVLVFSGSALRALHKLVKAQRFSPQLMVVVLAVIGLILVTLAFVGLNSR
jgi:hypothetical protein